MRYEPRRKLLAGAAVIAAMAVLAPAAGASIGTPSVALSPSSATAASTANLGTNIAFTPTGGDSVKNLTLQLPPGLIADASIDGGACLKSSTPLAACQVGSGSVTADVNVAPPLVAPALTLSAEFTLVAPPAAGDLAGLDVLVKDPISGQYGVLGTPAAVSFRSPSDPAGYGLNIAFSNIPDTYPLSVLGLPVATTSISVTAIDSTFNGLRFPSTCPASPARVSVSANSYSASAVQTTSAPLTVTGCGSAAYAPAFKVTAARDSADKQVTLTTAVTQTGNQLTSRSVALAFPPATLAPNLASIKALCLNLSAGCSVVGSATATSPLYPTALTGKAYLTGSSSGLSLTLVFPAPFSLTLTGAVNLVKNSAAFAGLPDIPLSNLGVTLNGGAEGLFRATCQTPSGTATASLVSQNGDRTVNPTSKFTVSGCSSPPNHTGGGTTGTGGGTNGGSGSGSTGGTTSTSSGTTRVVSTAAAGLQSGKPSLTFKVSVAKRASKISRITVGLPGGLSFVRHRVHKKLRVTGVSLR
ncbi:MAG TPA: hypothetical protein VHW04_01605, partial [Solirubrobacteraceae bacterium]|nr:hypothetical protein [Solirubrobacteraceae bacterium]